MFFVLIVVAASAVAFPIGNIIMKQWVAQYVKQAPITWWIYDASIRQRWLRVETKNTNTK